MRKAWKKAVSVLLTLVLIFGVLPGMNVSAEDEGGQGSGNSVEITLDNGTYDDTYKNKYGTIQYSTNYRDNSTSAEWKEISELTASDNQGKSKYTIQGENVYIKITYAQGSTYKAAIPNGVEVKDGVPIEITGGHIEFTDTSAGGGSQGGNPPQPTGGSLQFEGNAWSSYQNMKLYAGLELYVNPDNTGFVTLTDLLNQNKATFDESGMVCLLDESVTSVSIYAQLEKKDEYKIQFHGATQAVGTSEDTAITVNGTQHIQIDRKCLTVTWAYDDTYGEDGRIEHGTAEIIKINGQDVSQMTFSNFANNPGDKSGGHLAVKRDDVVTIKLIPDYGYQLSGASINGVTLAPQTEVSTFTFKMPDTNVHFKGIFTQTSDEINTSATKVSSASFENGANAAPSGNLRLTVADSNEDTTNALAQVANAVSAEAVNLTLDQIVSKENGNSWETPVTQFSQPVKMKLKVADYDTAAGYEVVREHNGNLTKLTTSMSEDGTLTFETNQFSTYFIVKTAKKADNGNAKTENSSNTSSTTASSAAGSTDNAITAQSVSGEGVPAINIASATDQLLNLAKLSEDENKAVKAGNKTQFVLSASGMTPTKEEIALIQSVLGNNVIGQCLNLNLTFKISGREDRQITDLSAPMYIAITIPQNLVNHDSSIERIYRIVRIHDGVATLIDGTYDAATNQFTFATDGFSTYALVYEDVNITLTGRSPKTGDSSMWMVWTLILCAGCGALFAAGKRYRKNR
ncbi:hypothetical protein [Roseburia inulinivorans]|uniref:Bacterial repeat domain-containing protein n=1 Tax=Roseburia inulinivorans TaxID=360807 RepID=A0A3R5WE53_9FIRM|nr:hypothetical protein [Roseburia inulinivorans]RGR69625.1 hypothetical protein DWY29_05585 [Roseburia inulinivorans]